MNDMSGTAVQLTGAGQVIMGVSAVVGLLVVTLAMLAPSERSVRRWADRYGLGLTDGNRPMIARYIRRTRSYRAVGGMAGWLSSMVFVAVTGRPFPLGGNSLALALAGYLLGAMMAEATSHHQLLARDAERSAVLVPRALTDYVAPVAVWALRLLPVITLGLAGLYALAPTQTQLVMSDSRPAATHVVAPVDPSHAFVWLVAGLLIVFAITVEVILRAIVARAQPVASEDLAAADDAVRASSIQAFCGAAISTLLVGVGWALIALSTTTSRPALGSIFVWLAIGAMISSIGAWVYVGHPRNWRVHHEAGIPAPTPS